MQHTAQTMSMSWGSSTTPPNAQLDDFDDSFGDFNDFDDGDDDFGDFAAGTAVSVDNFASHTQEAIPKPPNLEPSGVDQTGVFASSIHIDQPNNEESGEGIVHTEEDQVEAGISASTTSHDEVAPREQTKHFSPPTSHAHDTRIDQLHSQTFGSQEYFADEVDAGWGEHGADEVEHAATTDQIEATDTIEPNGDDDVVDQTRDMDDIPTEFFGTPDMEENNPIDVSSTSTSPHEDQPDAFQSSTNVEKIDFSHESEADVRKESFVDAVGTDGSAEEIEELDGTENVDEFGTFDHDKVADESVRFHHTDDLEDFEHTVDAEEFGTFDDTRDAYEYGSFDDADDFGDFDDTAQGDDFGQHDNFGEFDDSEFDNEATEAKDPRQTEADVQKNVQPAPDRLYEIPPNLKDAIDTADFGFASGATSIWNTTLGYMMPNAYDQENPKTFKEKQTVQELVMEAHESLYPTITWHALTVNTDDDNGIPKVQWRNSRIERMYLDALSCWRRQTPSSPGLTSPKIASRNDQSPVNSTKSVSNASAVPIEPNTLSTTGAQVPAMIEHSSPETGSLPRIATSKLPASDSAPASAASAKSFDLPSISQVVNQVESSNSPRLRASNLAQSTEVSSSPIAPETQSPVETSAQPSTPTQFNVKKQQSLGDAFSPVLSSSPTSHTFRPTPSSHPLTPTKFNSQPPRVASPGSRAASPLGPPKSVSQSPKDVSLESLGVTSSAARSSSPDQIAVATEVPEVQSIDIVRSSQAPPNSLSQVKSPSVTDSWLSSNDMSFLDSLGGSSASRSKNSAKFESLEDAARSPNNSISAASLGNLKTRRAQSSETTQPIGLTRPSKTTSESSVPPVASPLVVQEKKLDSWFTSDDVSFLDALGGYSSSTQAQSNTRTKLESPQFQQSPKQASVESFSEVRAPKSSLVGFTKGGPQTSLSPVTSPSSLGESQKRDSWLSSNDISFLDALGGKNTTSSKPKSNGKQVGLGILDLDMFESPNAQAPNGRLKAAAKILPKQTKPAPLKNSSGRLATTSSPPGWTTQTLSPTRSQTLSSLQNKPQQPSENLFDGFNKFGDLTSSVPIPSQPISSPSDSRWDIFRSASMSGGLSEWSSSLTSPPPPPHQAFMPAKQVPKSAEALDDFGDFTTPGDGDGDDFGEFGSPDIAWSNNQPFT